MKTILLCLLIFLVFISCKKADIQPLEGKWISTSETPNGLMISTISFTTDYVDTIVNNKSETDKLVNRYSIISSLIDGNKITTSSCQYGIASIKQDKVLFNINGQSLNWGEGRIIHNQLVIKQLLNKPNLIYIKQ